jgi:hypothetical protein
MTRQMTSSITSSIALEEARPTMILGIALEEAWPTTILGTTKHRCLHVFTLDCYGCDLVHGCYVVYGCDEYCDVWMNVLHLDVYMDVLCWRILCSSASAQNCQCSISLGVFSRYHIYIFSREEVHLLCLILTQGITQASTTRLYRSYIKKT